MTFSETTLIAAICYAYEEICEKLRANKEPRNPNSPPVEFMRTWVGTTHAIPSILSTEGWETFIRLAWAIHNNRPDGELKALVQELVTYGIFSAQGWGQRASLYAKMIIPQIVKLDPLARNIGPCI